MLTWRELGVLVRQLPRTSRLAVIRHGEDAEWSLADHLAALAVDALRVGNWQRANEGLEKYKQSRPPEPIERPGVKKKRRKQITTAQLIAFKKRTASRAA